MRAVAAIMQRLEARNIELAGLQVRKATLEDVFLELTGTTLESGNA